MSTTTQTSTARVAAPSTPPQKKTTTTKTAAAEIYQSTPSNHGSASFAQGAINASAKVKDTWPAIHNDVSTFQPCSLSAMQDYLLGRALKPGKNTKEALERCRAWASKQADKPEVKKLINALKATMKGSEKSMYRPYVELQNEIIAQARKATHLGLKRTDLEIICICSDPKVILGVHNEKTSYRRPDLVKVDYRVLRRKCATTGELEAPQSWAMARAWASEAFDSKNTFTLVWSQVLQTDELKKTRLDEDSLADIQKYQAPVKKDTASRVPLAHAGQVDLEKQITPSLVLVSQLKSSGEDTTSTGSKRKSGFVVPEGTKRQKTASTPAADGPTEDSAGGQDAEPTEGGAAPTDVDGDQVNPGPPPNLPARVYPAKEDDPDPPLPIAQLAMYASEMMTVPGMLRPHASGMLIQDYWVWLWYYDSAGAIQTQGFNVFGHIDHYVLFLMAFQRFSLEDFGFPTEVNSGERRRCITRGKTKRKSGSPTFTMVAIGPSDQEVEVEINPGQHIYTTSPVLKGRRTAVVGARELRNSEPTPTPLVAKWSYPQTKRPNEAKIVREAYNIVEDDAEALKTLPTVVGYKDFESTSTDLIRKCLRPPPTAASSTTEKSPAEKSIAKTATAQTATPTLIDEKRHGNRVLRCIIEKEVKPITYLSGIDLVKAIFQIMRCNKLLWRGNSKYSVEHSDISLGNMAVDPETLHGVLRDFDLARLVKTGDPRTPQGTERTGTVPFMALDLLTDEYWEGKITRLYRHDRESFIWVILYLAFDFDQDGLEVPNSVVRDWLTDDHNRCREKKTDFLARSRYHWLTALPNKEDKPLVTLANALVLELEREIAEAVRVQNRGFDDPFKLRDPDSNEDGGDGGSGGGGHGGSDDGGHGGAANPDREGLTADPDYLETFTSWGNFSGVDIADSTPKYNVAYYEQRQEKLQKLQEEVRAAVKAAKEENAARHRNGDENPELVKQGREERDAAEQDQEDEKIPANASKQKVSASKGKGKAKAASAPRKAKAASTSTSKVQAASTSKAQAALRSKVGSTPKQNATSGSRTRK